MKNKVLEKSKTFWLALEKSDVITMRSICDERINFVHIGGNCTLDHEMQLFEDGVFQPTEIIINNQQIEVFDDVAIVITDCSYGLLLGGNPTTHHFTVTEVYQQQEETVKMIQFTFTALVN